MNTKEAKEMVEKRKLSLDTDDYHRALFAKGYLEAIEKTEEFIEKLNRHRCIEPADCRVCIAIDEWEAEK